MKYPNSFCVDSTSGFSYKVLNPLGTVRSGVGPKFLFVRFCDVLYNNCIVFITFSINNGNNRNLTLSYVCVRFNDLSDHFFLIVS